MKAKNSTYTSKPMSADGTIDWTDEENAVWKQLMDTQLPKLADKACDEYLKGVEILGLTAERLPQIPELNKALNQSTGWAVEPVPCLIPFSRFFELLASKRFPCATFIRRQEDLHYITEPDIFHEVFGHCPMLTDPHFATFTHRYGQLGLAATPKQRVYLARLYWFTAEFGMIKQNDQWRFYGGGIMSSPSEAENCLKSEIIRKELQPVDSMRTPYRIDIVQPIYYYIENLSDLSKLSDDDILNAMHTAMELGLFEPTYELA